MTWILLICGGNTDYRRHRHRINRFRAGYDVGWIQSVNGFEFTATVSSAGSYLIEIPVASGEMVELPHRI